jgi:hypothetical protein
LRVLTPSRPATTDVETSKIHLQDAQETSFKTSNMFPTIRLVNLPLIRYERTAARALSLSCTTKENQPMKLVHIQ